VASLKSKLILHSFSIHSSFILQKVDGGGFLPNNYIHIYIECVEATRYLRLYFEGIY
jgi:hypothetical protein